MHNGKGHGRSIIFRGKTFLKCYLGADSAIRFKHLWRFNVPVSIQIQNNCPDQRVEAFVEGLWRHQWWSCIVADVRVSTVSLVNFGEIEF